jgi:hypothetical protein
VHLDVAIRVNEQILRLQVAVHNQLGVEVLEGIQHARRVEAGVVVWDVLHVARRMAVEVVEELSPEAQLDEHVERVGVLHRGDEGKDEWVLRLNHHVLLADDIRLEGGESE